MEPYRDVKAIMCPKTGKIICVNSRGQQVPLPPDEIMKRMNGFYNQKDNIAHLTAQLERFRKYV